MSVSTKVLRALCSAVLVTGLFSGLPAAAQDPVPASQLAKLVDIPHQQFTLDNGLRVFVHTDRKAPVVAVSVWYAVGSKHEPKGKTGFAHLFEHLMFNGSENAPGDFFEPLQQVGATDFNGTTWLDRTNYFETVPTGALERALFLESDRMGHLLGAVTQEKLDNQRGVVQNEKRQGDNQPYGLVRYATFESLFPKGHPYHHSTIGSMADLSAASLADVKQWFIDNYGPNNAVLVLAGDVDLTTAKTLVQKYFGDIKRGAAVRKVDAPVPTLDKPKTEIMKDRVATTRIYRMWTFPGLNDKSAAAMEAAASVLGGLSSSRLDNSLVRKEKIAVAVTASAQIFQHASVFSVSADVKPGGDAAAVGRRLDEVIAEFLRDGPTADELRRATTTAISGAINGFESVGGFSGKATALAEGALYSNDSSFYRKQLKAWSALTPASVKAATRKWLSRPVYSLTVEPGERTESGAERGGAVFEDAAISSPSYYAAPGQEGAAGTAWPAVDRSKLPEVGALAALDFPAIERATLSNGMQVYLARRSAAPTVNLSVSFDAGFGADPKTGLGIQSLMLSLMKEGTASRDSVAIAEQEERLGASIQTAASFDRTAVTLNAMTPNLLPSLDLLADIVRNPKFDASEVERMRGQQLARISQELNNPNAIASRVLLPVLYGPQHPYGVPPSGTGDPAVVQKVSRDELAAFHRDWFRPDNGRILATGNVAMKDLVAALEKSFGNWQAPQAPLTRKSFDAAPPAPEPRIILVDRPKSPQSVIHAGHVVAATGKDDLIALQAANEIFGGSFLSRINTNLRETKGWSYGVRSQVAEYQEGASFIIRAPVQADRTGDSMKELIADMKAFLNDKGVTDEEKVRTINGNTRSLPGSFETSGAVLGGLINIVNYNRADDYYEKLAAKYQGLDTKQIDAAGRAKLDVKKLVFVVVGDASVVKPQLDSLDIPVEVIPAPQLN